MKLIPSRDPLASGEVWDVGHGHVLMPGEQRRPITAAEALELLHWDLTLRADVIDAKMLKIDVDQCQFDALLAFAFNVGLDDDDDSKPEGLGDSRLLRMVNAGNVSVGAIKNPAASVAIAESDDITKLPAPVG